MSEHVEKGAVLSPDGVYRYRLWRVWDQRVARCAFVMLNPSTADAEADDPTIRRCMGFARRWGFGGIDVVNLYAYRATNPVDLPMATFAIGPDNGAHIDAVVRTAGLVVAAWGSHKSSRARGVRVGSDVAHLRDLYALALTKDGAPKHPLYLRGDLKPVLYRATVAAKEGR